MPLSCRRGPLRVQENHGCQAFHASHRSSISLPNLAGFNSTSSYNLHPGAFPYSSFGTFQANWTGATSPVNVTVLYPTAAHVFITHSPDSRGYSTTCNFVGAF